MKIGVLLSSGTPSTHLASATINNVAFERLRIASVANADIPAILCTACS
jgi:hypothetical protein